MSCSVLCYTVVVHYIADVRTLIHKLPIMAKLPSIVRADSDYYHVYIHVGAEKLDVISQ